MTTKARPKSQKELEDWLSNPGEVSRMLSEEPEEFASVITGYAQFQMTDGLKSQLEEARKQGEEKFMLENGIDFKGGNSTRPPLGGVMDASKGSVSRAVRALERASRSAKGAELNGQYEGFSDFLVDAFWKSGNVSESGRRSKALNESQGDQGGFLVPEEFRAELLMMGLEQAIVRPRARVIPMTSPILRFPTIRDTTHASNVHGGVVGVWNPEGADLSTAANQSEPTFGSVALTAKTLSAYTVVGNELIADAAITLEGVLMELFADALAYFEDDAFINGIGGGQPVGILNADALVSVAKETGQAATTIVWENIIKMYSRMLPAALNRGVWVANTDTMPQLATMSINVGTGGAPVWISNAIGGPPSSILGRPLIFSEKAQTLGTAGDIYFVDFGSYLIGDRQSMSVASSEHKNFQLNQTVWRFLQRLDGRPWIDSALTPRNGSNTVSPFVNLATRS